MIRKYFILIVCSLLSVVAFADPVTKEQARQIASQFLNAKGGTHRAPAQLAELPPVLNAVDKAGNPYIYAFNAGHDGGYVLVSGDDRFRDVLAYGASGNFDNDDMPAHIKAWLQGYVDEMKYYESVGYQPSTETTASSSAAGISYHRAIKSPIPPLLTTAWDQGDPYNRLCPLFFNGELSVTGCVATAMAQVVCYTARRSGNQPTTLKKDIPSYTCSSNWSGYGHLSVSGITASDITFDWDNMRDTYKNGAYNNDEANAVATLMVCCGESVEMDYSNNGSGANTSDVANALITYFGFDNTTKAITRSNYSYAQWIELMYAELAAGRPVQYGGSSSGGGHSFVIDGYDGDEMFHVNWGWSGNPDSYYALSVLNPNDNSGIGASSSNDGYSFSQKAIVGIQYGTGEEGEANPVTMTTENLSVEETTILWKTYNYNKERLTFNTGLGQIDEYGNISPIYTFSTVELDYGWGYSSLSYPLQTNVSKKNQSIKIVPISKLTGADVWSTDVNPDIVYVEVVYDANGVPTLTAHPILDLETTSIDFTGSKYTNEKQPVEVTVRNNGDEFYGVLYLFASTTSDKGNAVNKGGFTIQKNKTGSLTFEWTPETPETYNIWVATDDKGENVIGSTSVDIGINASAPTGDFMISALGVKDADNTSWKTDTDGKILVDVYSNNLVISPTITNISIYTYSTAQFDFKLYKQNGEFWDLLSGYTLTVGDFKSGNSVTWHDLSFGIHDYGTYKVELSDGSSILDDRYIINLTMGYTAIDEYGKTVSVKATDTDIIVANDVTAVDLTNLDYTSVTPNSNPNTLYIIGSGQTAPESLDGKNVVKGGVAEQITLTDGHAFYSPVDFTATNISYTRTESTYYDKDTQKGWTTLVLPFAPAGIKTYVGETKYDLTWFTSAEETDKNLWLMKFDDEHNGIVDFGYAGSTLEANKPYIMALPGDSYGNKWSLEGLPIIFYAANADIKANAKATTVGTNYKFVGTTLSKTNLTDIYKLNADGDQFVLGTTASIEPFRAYFAPTSTAATATELSIGFGRNVITNVLELKGVTEVKDADNNNIYNMNGQRVNKPVKGLYIVNGKKVVIK